MAAGDIALLALGASMAALILWAMWPRSRPGAGPRNNWRQRSADGIQSGRTEAAGDFDSPYLIAYEDSSD
jgi:hypothetical protein